ncbi:hypothetical protein [Nisaea sediminum]|uniref:hypothetical protein n=1 Tax=Nisaea sediminum TaxID=2775867 RepID=UPI0018686F67|nr:hypothetical protein [Nisaea sediminum]
MAPAVLLPLQPIPPDSRQRELAREFLSDHEKLHAYFGRLRKAVDAELAPAMPEFAGKPYPLGRCREIRDTLYDRLIAELHAPACETSSALRAFIQAGGIGRKIWGVLRESYFQNAMQFGPWYVDVSNDTVNPNKPQIEILPIEESGMVAVEDFFHFARIANSYWQCEVYANSVAPGIAAIFPMICCNKDGAAWLAVASDQMIAMTRSREFRPALEFVEGTPEPPEPLARLLKARLARCAHEILSEEGDPREAIKARIAASSFRDETYYTKCVDAFHAFQDLSGN